MLDLFYAAVSALERIFSLQTCPHLVMVSMASAYTDMKNQSLATRIFDDLRRRKIASSLPSTPQEKQGI